MGFKRMLTTSVQFTEKQMSWLEEKIEQKANEEGRKVFLAEVIRDTVNAQMKQISTNSSTAK